MTIGGYTEREWEWIREARRPRLPHNVWGWRPGTYAEVMAEAADNDAIAAPTQPAAEHTASLPKELRMTEYAVAVEYTGDFIVEAENEDEARAHVEAIIPSSTPDSDWYFVQIVGVREES